MTNPSFPFKVTREKHLDHMVRVVPLLFLGYSLQVFFLAKLRTALGAGPIIFLGVSLALMIALFIVYDLKHSVSLYENHLEIDFLGLKKKIEYTQIEKALITTPEDSFSNILIIHNGKNTRLFFIDNCETVVEKMKPSSKKQDQAA